jgi:predicted PurR-regulated permease PerM
MPERVLPPARRLRFVRVRSLVAIAAWAGALTLVLYFFPTVSLMVEGVIAASALAAAMRPVAERVPGPRGLRGVLAGMIPLVIAIGLVALSSWLVGRNLSQQASHWPELKQKLDNLLDRAGDALGVGSALRDQLAPGGWIDAISSQGGKILGATAAISSRLLVWIAFVFIGTIFLLIEPPGALTRPVIAFFPVRRQQQLQAALDDLEPQLRGWVLGTLVICVIVALLSWGAYRLVGLPMAEGLALLAGVAEILPNIGPLILYIPAALLAATQGVWAFVLITLAYVVIHVVEAYILSPYIFERSVKMPPFVTLFSIIFWGEILGLPGLLLAIPLDLTLWTFATHLKPQVQPAAKEGVPPKRESSDAEKEPGRMKKAR